MKSNKSLVFIYFFAFIFLTLCLSSTSNATSAPDIKANNVVSAVILDTSDTLSITVSMDAGTSVGLNADWWVAADTPFGWHYYVYPYGWYYAPTLSNLQHAYQGPLFSLSPVEVLNISGLPVGTYVFYFAVDTNANAIIDAPLFYDSVSVNVRDGGDAGNIYYVATNGSDTNPGTENQPWQTIQKAANTLIAGDIVYIKAGTYQESVIPLHSGSSGNPITYTSYPGNTVTIDGNGISISEWGGLFAISDKSYIIISGLRIINSSGNGILVNNSSHITVEKNYTYNTVSSGIGVWDSNNITIDGNEVELACNDGEHAQECITVAGTNAFEVKNNHVHHSGLGTYGGEGIDAKDGSFNGKVYKNYVHHINKLGIYVEAWDKHTYNIDVFQNRVHDCEDGITLASEQGGLLENIGVYNNIAYHNTLNGISLSSEGAYRPMRNIRIINNTSYNNGSIVWGGGISIENPDVDNLVIRNNIVSQNLTFQIQVEVPVLNLSVDHNLIDGYRGYPDETYGNDYVTGNPIFVDTSLADFHLQNGSPAIDAGSSVNAPSTDFEGNTRPSGNGYDIGAYER